MTKWELERRSFLKALGVGAGMIPLLTETRALAQPAARGRLVTFVEGNAMRPQDFWPTWANGRPADGSLADAVLPYCTKPLEPWKKQLLFTDGITLRNWLKSEGNPTGDSGDSHHDWGVLLTGEFPSERLLTTGGCRLNASPPGCRMLAASPSLDCWVGGELQRKDPSLRFQSLNVGVMGTSSAGGMSCSSWFGKDRPNGREADPYKVFATIFGGAELKPGTADPDAVNRTRERLRILDFVGKDIQRFGRRLGTEDREMLDAHLQTISMRSKQLQQLIDNPIACGKPQLAMGLALGEANTGKLAPIMADLLVDAMKCGLVRSSQFTLLDTNAYNTYFTWLKDINPNFSSSKTPGLKVSEFPELHFHSLTHGSGREPGTQMYKDANRWHIEVMAHLLKRLSSEPEGAGTMLDSTLVLWADTLSSGGGHSVYRLPWLLAGNVGNYFKTGRHVVVGKDVAPNGLFVSIATALGVPPPDGVFGNPRWGKGEMPGLRG